jgi:hypothetical protein
MHSGCEWIDERRAIFLDAIATLELPVETSVDNDNVVLTPLRSCNTVLLFLARCLRALPV